MNFSNQVIVLQIFLKRDAEWCDRAIGQIKRAIKRPLYPAMHDRRHISYVITSRETPKQLVDRIRPLLQSEEISNFWAMTPVNNVCSRDGGIDALASRVSMAYANIRKGSKPKNVIHVQVPRSKLKNKTTVQMPIKTARKSQGPQ